MINLKISPGTHTTNQSTLNTVAYEDKYLFREQYQYYNPDWTICGRTGDLFTHVTWDNQIAWETTTRGVRWFMREANKYVVAFAHPEARVDDSLLVYGLLDAIREIIQSSLSDL